MDFFSSNHASAMQFHLLPTRANCEEEQLRLRSASGSGLLLDEGLPQLSAFTHARLAAHLCGAMLSPRAHTHIHTSALVVMATCDFSGVPTLSLCPAEADTSQPKNK